MIKYKFIGWCNEDNHDKVWGVIHLEGDPGEWDNRHKLAGPVLVFWGRRGKKLQCQIKPDDYHMYKLIEKKKEKYTRIDPSRLEEVYPEFRDDLEKTTFWAQLSK